MQACQVVAAFFEEARGGSQDACWDSAFVLHLKPGGEVSKWPACLERAMENLVSLEVDSGHSLPAFGVNMPRLKVLRLSNCASPSSLEVRGCSCAASFGGSSMLSGAVRASFDSWAWRVIAPLT
jgi:hypothetical protein